MPAAHRLAATVPPLLRQRRAPRFCARAVGTTLLPPAVCGMYFFLPRRCVARRARPYRARSARYALLRRIRRRLLARFLALDPGAPRFISKRNSAAYSLFRLFVCHLLSSFSCSSSLSHQRLLYISRQSACTTSFFGIFVPAAVSSLTAVLFSAFAISAFICEPTRLLCIGGARRLCRRRRRDVLNMNAVALARWAARAAAGGTTFPCARYTYFLLT